MEQKHAVIVFFVLIVMSGLVSLTSYKMTEQRIDEDMSRALAQALAKQQSDVISTDTIHLFNNFLQIKELRGKVFLAVNNDHHGFHPVPYCSFATIFRLSHQSPAFLLAILALMWGMLCLWQRRRMLISLEGYGGLSYSEFDHSFYNIKGEQVKLTPMQQQLLEMFFNAPSHTLTKGEICNALWPKKDDASETLYTLIRRMKPVVESQSQLMITSNRGRSYELKVREMSEKC